MKNLLSPKCVKEKDYKSVNVAYYVSYDIALLLRNKGYKEKGTLYYLHNQPKQVYLAKQDYYNKYSDKIVAPFFNQARDWLENNFGICISIKPIILQDNLYYKAKLYKNPYFKQKVIIKQKRASYSLLTEAINGSIYMALLNI